MDARHTPLWRVVDLAQPAVGAEFSLTPTNAAGWLVQSLRFLCTTSAVVATRVPSLLFTNGSIRWGGVCPANGQAATTTFAYLAVMGMSRGSVGGSHIAMDWPVGGVWLPQGHSITSFTDNRDAGDQFSAIAASVIEYPTGEGVTMWPFPPSYLEESS